MKRGEEGEEKDGDDGDGDRFSIKTNIGERAWKRHRFGHLSRIGREADRESVLVRNRWSRLAEEEVVVLPQFNFSSSVSRKM